MAKQVPIELVLKVRDLTGKGIQDAHRALGRQLRAMRSEPVPYQTQMQQRFYADLEARRASEAYGVRQRNLFGTMGDIERTGLAVALEQQTASGISKGVAKGFESPMSMAAMGRWSGKMAKGFGAVLALEATARFAGAGADMVRSWRAGDTRGFNEAMRAIPGLSAVERIASFPQSIIGVKSQADFDRELEADLDRAEQARRRMQEHRRYLLTQAREDRAANNELEAMQDRRGLLGLEGFELRRATVDVGQRAEMRRIEEERRQRVESIEADPFMDSAWKAERILRAKTDFEQRKTEIQANAAAERKRIAEDEARSEWELAKLAKDTLADEIDAMTRDDAEQQAAFEARRLGVAKSIMADLQGTGGYRAAPLLMSSTLQAPIQHGGAARVTPGEQQIVTAIREREKGEKHTQDLLRQIVDKLGNSALLEAPGL